MSSVIRLRRTTVFVGVLVSILLVLSVMMNFSHTSNYANQIGVVTMRQDSIWLKPNGGIPHDTVTEAPKRKNASQLIWHETTFKMIRQGKPSHKARTAVCFAGQIRTFYHPLIHEPIRLSYKDLDADYIFLSSDGSDDESKNQLKWEQLVNSTSIFKSKDNKVHIEQLRIRLNKQNMNKSCSYKQIYQAYGMRQCLRTIEAFEAERGEVYDFVVKPRFDMLNGDRLQFDQAMNISQTCYFNSLRPNISKFDEPAKKIGFASDRFMLCPREAARKIFGEILGVYENCWTREKDQYCKTVGWGFETFECPLNYVLGKHPEIRSCAMPGVKERFIRECNHTNRAHPNGNHYRLCGDTVTLITK